jgi:hypothetical protein
MAKYKKSGFGLDIHVVKNKEGKQFLVFKTRTGAYNVFAELTAKEIARELGIPETNSDTTRTMWSKLLKQTK